MKTVRSIDGQKPWQLAAVTFNPSRSPWHRYSPDQMIDRYVLAILAANTRPAVGEMPLENLYALEEWPAGFMLTIPDNERANAFPEGTDPKTHAERLGYGAEGSTRVNGFVDLGGVLKKTDTDTWVEAWQKQLDDQRRRYGDRVGRGLPADKPVLRYEPY